MTDDELIQALRRHRAAAPPAPEGEWEAIAARTTQASAWSWLKRPALALAGGLALAALALTPWMPWSSPAPALDETAELEELIQDAGSIESPEASDAYLELLASIS